MFKKLFCLCVTLFTLLITENVTASDVLRIAVVENQSTAEVSCEGEFSVMDVAGNITVLPAGKYFLHEKEGRLAFDNEHSFVGRVIIKAPLDTVLPEVNKHSYKGELVFSLSEGKILAVNNIDLETYLASVLPAKTMVVWPDEVIKAQAVAARSYALYMKRQNRYKPYDLSSNDNELDYEGTGMLIEKAAVTTFIEVTSGQYLVNSDGLPIKAVTTSSSGGRTESAWNLWGKRFSYLQSVEDYDRDSPDYEWEYRVTPAILENLLAQRGYGLGKLNSIRLSPLKEKGADRTPTGRVKYLIVVGSLGSAKISGEELAQLINLKSTLFDLETATPVPETLKVPIENRYGMEMGSKDIGIKVNRNDEPVWKNLVQSYHMLSGGKGEKIIFTGKGKGTGVGLSAWGARGMVLANENITYNTILMHYYPNTKLRYR